MPDVPVLPALFARLLTPEELARLAADHQDDGSGRCAGCWLPQSGGSRWPCTLHSNAVTALDMVTGRRRAS